jgi:hypothetical protein
MSDIRARRTAALAAAAKAKSEAKAHAADQAIRRLVRRGEPVTFQAVQREAGVAVLAAEGHGDAVYPPLGEYLDGAGLEPVADLLQPGRVIAGREAVGQLGEGDAGPQRLPLGPLVPVDPTGRSWPGRGSRRRP